MVRKFSEFTSKATPIGTDEVVGLDNVASNNARMTVSALGTAVFNANTVSDISDVTIIGIASNEILKWNGSAWVNNTLTEAGILGLAGGTMSGDINLGSNDITSVNRFDYDYAEGTVSALGNLGATEAIDWSTASHFTGTLDANVTITHSNEVSGQKITLVLSYDGTAQRTITWSDVDVWLDGTDGSAPASPSAASQVLVVTLLFVGTTCYAQAGGNYAL